MTTDELVVSSPALARIVALHAALRVFEEYGARAPVEQHGSRGTLAPAPLDLFRELQACTPESLRYVLQDLFGQSRRSLE